MCVCVRGVSKEHLPTPADRFSCSTPLLLRRPRRHTHARHFVAGSKGGSPSPPSLFPSVHTHTHTHTHTLLPRMVHPFSTCDHFCSLLARDPPAPEKKLSLSLLHSIFVPFFPSVFKFRAGGHRIPPPHPSLTAPPTHPPQLPISLYILLRDVSAHTPGYLPPTTHPLPPSSVSVCATLTLILATPHPPLSEKIDPGQDTRQRFCFDGHTPNFVGGEGSGENPEVIHLRRRSPFRPPERAILFVLAVVCLLGTEE